MLDTDNMPDDEDQPKPKILFLASNSPRRHELLNQLRIEHQVLSLPKPETVGVDDEPQMPNELPLSYVQRTAKEKLDKAIQYIQEQIDNKNEEYLDKEIFILTADTVVTAKNEILGKPISAEHAAIMLSKLSDEEHTVYTAIALWHQDTFYKDISSTQVQFGPLSDEQICYYCQTDEPYGKAGAYAIQGMAAGFVKHLRGSYTGVVGLPAFETLRLLQRSGFTD